MKKNTIVLKAALAIVIAIACIMPSSAAVTNISNDTTQENHPSSLTYISSEGNGQIPFDTTLYVDDDYNETTPGWGIDHFAKIQNAINAAQPGDTIFVYKGIYPEQVVINKAVEVVGEDNINTRIMGPGTTPNVVSFYHTSDAQFYNFHVETDGAETNWRPLIFGELSSHCSIGNINVGIDTPKCYGVELDFCDNMTFSNSTVHAYFRAFYIQGTIDSLFSNLQVQSLNEDGFDVFGATYIPTGETRGAVRNTYSNIDITIGGDRGFQGAWLDNITIDDMTVTGGISLSILAQNAPDAVITNSTGSGCSWGIAFNDAPRGRIADCTYTNSGSNVGFGAWYGSSVVIERCIAENNGLTGVLIQEAPDSLISQCTALNSSYEGIDVTWAPNTIISDCIVHNSPSLKRTWTSPENEVAPPTINQLIIPTSGNTHVEPLLSSQMLLTKILADKAVPTQYTTTTKDTNVLVQQTTEQDASYTTVNVAEEYRDVRGLSIGQSAKAEILKITDTQKHIQNIYGVGLWESEGCFILDCTITNMPIGINLISSPQTTVQGNTIVNGTFYLTGEYWQNIDLSNTINGKPLQWIDGADHQIIDNPDVGFLAIVNSDNMTIQNYYVNNDGWGLLLFNTKSSLVQNCGFTENLRGLGIIDCSGITVQNTVLSNNNINLDIFGGNPQMHTIATTTTVNGKPVQYLTSLSYEVIDGNNLDIGYLGLLSCDNVTVQNVTMSQNGQGILIVASSDIIISNCSLTENDIGVYLDDSTMSGAKHAENTISYNTYGMYLGDNSELVDLTINNNINNNVYVTGANNLVSRCIVNGASAGIVIGPGASHNLLDDVESIGAWGYAISLVGCHNNTLTFIKTSYASSVGVHFEEAADNIISNWESSNDYRGSWGIGYRNTIENAVIAYPTSNIMWQYYSKGYLLHNITGYGVSDSWGDGIMISASENFMVTDCSVSNSPVGFEISFVPGNNHTIMGCTVSGVTDYALGMEVGISWPYGVQHGLFAANNNTIVNCEIIDNTGIGFLQQEFAQSATIDQCTFQGNGIGMWLQFVQNDVVKNTIIADNEYNFGLVGYKQAHYLTNDIQSSTTVNGKQVMFIIGQSGLLLDNPDVGWLGLVQCDNITLKNFAMQQNGQGVLFAFCVDSTITNCAFTQNRLSIELYGCTRCMINNCTASDGAGGILVYDSYSNMVVDTEASNNAAGGDPGIYLLNSPYSTILRCDVSANTHPDPSYLLYNFVISSSSNSTVSNVTMLDTEYAANIQTSRDLSFSHITVLRATDFGFYFTGVSYTDLADSTFERVGTQTGIYLYQSSYNHIWNCIVRNSPTPSYYGLALTYSSNNNLVEDCIVTNASLYYGIAIFYSANNNLIRNCESTHAPSGQGCYIREASGNVFENCTSSYNAQWGFRIRIAIGNMIKNCTASNNIVGIYVHENSHDNMFYYNNLMENTQGQVYDDNVNSWDDGSHGNYYSDYSGIDADGDGVGDTPYPIPGGTMQDLYPKMMPYPNQPPVAAFTWSPLIPIVGEPVQFNSSESYDPDGSIDSWYWTFGDGYDSTIPNPTHVYIDGGMFTVSLTVTEKWNPPSSTTITHPVFVQTNHPPVAVAGPDHIVNTSTIVFDGSASYDPDGYIIAYIWEFGDGAISYDMITSHTYDPDGIYIVTLTVMDNEFLLGSDTALVVLDRVKPLTFTQLVGTNGENGWYTSAVTINLIPTDDRSGVVETFYRIDGGSWITYTTPFAVTTDGVYTIEYYSTDAAGNNEDVKTVGVSIDMTPPDLTLTIEKIGIQTWAINVTAEDATSGVSKVEFYIDDTLVFTDSTEPYGYIYNGPKDVTAKVIAYDNAGLHSSDESTVSVSYQPQILATKQTLDSTPIETIFSRKNSGDNIR